MSSILRPNGSPYHHTRMPRVKQTGERKAAINAAYDRADALSVAAWNEANRAIKAGEITGTRYVAMVGEARAAGDRLVREAKEAR